MRLKSKIITLILSSSINLHEDIGSSISSIIPDSTSVLVLSIFITSGSKVRSNCAPIRPLTSVTSMVTSNVSDTYPGVLTVALTSASGLISSSAAALVASNMNSVIDINDNIFLLVSFIFIVSILQSHNFCKINVLIRNIEGCGRVKRSPIYLHNPDRIPEHHEPSYKKH
ncbi:MAG: hypothetical protein DNFNHJIP_00612 [Candidatus Argoarchaeum ethanivorans]|uniref:Uncharacterized protein n=1 Tax=Candidatus Argoarchaeum ethanivorans TaxID=2608793 RepID=A0A812A335_9EURY|nr:MAG: hypothetical protein DNFNHJIP_00612 [Candidatus Argoarchaeum ethanivorans]